MKKKTYERPQMSVIEVEQTDIICTSGASTFSLESDGEIGDGGNGAWGTDLTW